MTPDRPPTPTWLASLQHPGVATAEVTWREPLSDALQAYPEEAASVARAVPSRRAEFAAGRACARRALAHLGYPPAPILRGPRGEPGWPPGVVGSITHTSGYAAAAVAAAEVLGGLGIDAEPNAALPEGVLQTIASPAEQEHLARLAGLDEAICWDRLLFCAKESLFKVWYPLAGCWLDFTEADIRFRRRPRTFHAELLRALPPRFRSVVLEGRWTCTSGFLLTALSIPPE
ncbi:MAG: 4'-phosphopantetheinyl transferase family protein [Dermatophilaceae bacterium]